MSWEEWVMVCLLLVVLCFVAGFIDVWSDDRKRRKKQEELERFLREH